jgi:hypothetical protein
MTADSRNIAVATAGFCAFLNLYSPQALLPTLSREFGVGAAEISSIMTASALAIALTAPFTGALADVLGRKRLARGFLGARRLLVGRRNHGHGAASFRKKVRAIAGHDPVRAADAPTSEEPAAACDLRHRFRRSVQLHCGVHLRELSSRGGALWGYWVARLKRAMTAEDGTSN